MAVLENRCVLAVAGSVFCLAGCDNAAPSFSPDSIGATTVTHESAPICTSPAAFSADTIATGLDTPWDVAFLDDGTAFVTERAGRILRFPPDGTGAAPWLDPGAYSPEGSEIGLMGLDATPDGEWLYFTVTESAPSGPFSRIARRISRLFDPEKGHQIGLTVYRVAVGEVGSAAERVTEPIPAGFIHGGGALRFGPAGSLLFTNGDGGDHWRAQVANSYRGKLFDLGPPSNALEPGRVDPAMVHATGIRHSQGLTWTPNGHLLAIDHGPTGLDSEANRTDRDELNVIEPGANLGWPVVAGSSQGGGLTSPLVEWTPALAPAGLAWFSEPGSPWDSSVFVTGLRGTRLVRLQVADEPSGVRVSCSENLLQNTHGRLRLVRQAPDGSLWVGTSNRDGRGVPRDFDDLILRLRPVDPA